MRSSTVRLNLCWESREKRQSKQCYMVRKQYSKQYYYLTQNLPLLNITYLWFNQDFFKNERCRVWRDSCLPLIQFPWSCNLEIIIHEATKEVRKQQITSIMRRSKACKITACVTRFPMNMILCDSDSERQNGGYPCTDTNSFCIKI